MPPAPQAAPPGPIRVLVVNQTATTSGAEHSLLTLIAALDPADVHVTVASPVGRLSERLAELGIDHVAIRGTDASFRLDLRTTPVELLGIVRSAAQIARAVRRTRAQVIHANTTRAGLIAIAARAFGAPRPIVHIRDWAPPSRASAVVTKVVARGAAAIIGNSRHVVQEFAAMDTRGTVQVIHNAVDLLHFDPARTSREEARAALGFGTDVPLVGVIGQLTPWKGQDDAVRAVAEARRLDPDRGACLVVAGSAKFSEAAARFDNAAYAEELAALPAALGCAGAVTMLGEVDDVPTVLAALDVLLVPSWEEAFGRVVVEGMAMGLPVIATAVGGPPEIIDDGRTGFLLPPRDPAAWGALLAELLADEPRRRAVGAAAREAAQRFSPAAHAAAVLPVYRALAG